MSRTNAPWRARLQRGSAAAYLAFAFVSCGDAARAPATPAPVPTAPAPASGVASTAPLRASAEPPAPSAPPSAAPPAPEVAPAARPALWVPTAVASNASDPRVRARVSSATAGDTFPSRPAPSLSGPLRGLAFGMSAAEARAAAPGFAAAFRVYAEADTRDTWLPLGSGKGRVRIHRHGLDMIEIEYPTAAVARSTLTAAWGEPHAGESAFEWKVWTNREHSIRAVLMKADNDLRRVELLPYRPLAELLADGGELSFAGKHLLDCTEAELAPLLGHKSGPDAQLLPTELSSGHIPLRVRTAAGAVDQYTLGVDYTYARETAATIEAALAKHFGRPTPEAAEPGSKKACRTYAPSPRGVHARACDLYSQWQITVARAGTPIVP